jgi:hypothetical protein
MSQHKNSIGGLAVLKKYGRDHFSRIGKRGAKTFHKRYRLSPVDLNDFAIVNRKTGERVNTLLGKGRLYRRDHESLRDDQDRFEEFPR